MQDTTISYKASEAREYGINVAILLNNIRVFTEYHEQKGDGGYYHSIKDIAEAVGMSTKQLSSAASKAKELGLIDYKQSYKPGTQERTTFWYITDNTDVSQSDERVISEIDKRSLSETNKRSLSLYNLKDINIKRDNRKELDLSFHSLNEFWHERGGRKLNDNKTARKAVSDLLKHHTVDEIKFAITGAVYFQGMKYKPQVMSFKSMYEKWDNLIGHMQAMKKEVENAKSNQFDK